MTTARITKLAGVSSRTFYQHFEDLWACLLAAHEVEAGRLCAAIEAGYAGAAERSQRGRRRLQELGPELSDLLLASL